MTKTILFYSGSQYRGRIDDNNYIKIFNWDKYKYNLDRCTAEVICRTYLDKKGLNDITTKKQNIEPEGLRNKLDELNADNIQQNFNNIFDEIKDYIREHCVKVSIDIEEASPISSQRLSEIANSEEKRKEFIKKLFEILAIIHKNNLVHRDIKIDNLMYVTRKEKELLVLNDWDASFLLQNDLTEGLRYTLPIATPQYAAPEQMSTQNMKIGTHTDIWQAGMVAYYLCNDRRFPESYDNIDFEKDSKQNIMRKMNKVFEDFKNHNKSFPDPENNDDIWSIISQALNVNPKNRPKAENITANITARINEQTNGQKIPDYEKPDANPLKEAKQTVLSADEEYYKIKQEKEKKSKRNNRIAIFVVLLGVAGAGLLYSRDNRTDNPAGTPSDTSQFTNETTSPPVQTEQTSTEKTVYITETIPPAAPIKDNTETSVDEDTENLDYTYTTWVENYYFGDGYYTGGFDENGHVHGKGCIYEKDNGDKYEGDYYHGLRHGYGVQITDEYTYEGYWQNDMMCDDDCTFTYSNGNIYTGGVRNNTMNGYGKYRLKVSDRDYQGTYIGYFSDGNFEGIGTFEYDNGDRFEGEFKQHKRWNGEITRASNGLVQKIKNGEPEK